MKIIDYYEIDLPDYSLSYLMNGDSSGLEDSDIKTIDEWHAGMLETMERKFPGCTYVLILKDDCEGSFTRFPDFGLSCNCVDAVFAVFADNADPRPEFALPWADEDEIEKIKSLYSQIMASEVFRIGGPQIDLVEVLADLANALHTAENLPEFIWSFGEFSEAPLGDLVAGAYWSLSEWHGGQYSDTYAAMCALGRVFSPGMVSGPEPDSCESIAYDLVGEWLERKAGK